MPDDDLRNTGSLFADLWRELSWPLRLGLFGGLVAGLAYGIYLVSQEASEAWRTGWLRLLVLFILGLSVLGGFLGLVAGVILDFAIKAVLGERKPEMKKKKKRRRERE